MKYVLPLLSLLISINAASACTGGQEFTRDVGKYTVDVTNDTPAIEPGQPVHFDFGLFNKSDPRYAKADPVPFTHVTFAIMHGDQTMLAQTLPTDADRELVGFDYTFPAKHADYTLSASYYHDKQLLADASFPIRAGMGDQSSPSARSLVYLGVGLLVVIGCALTGSRLMRAG